MRSIAQLTAGARRATPRALSTHARAEEAPPRRPAAGRDPCDGRDRGGDRPALPPDASREALVRLVETVAPRLGPRGLTDKDLRALRAIVTACRWEDFVRADRDPVCFRQQQRLAAEIGVTPGHFRKIEAKLERAGLIARATCENGHRGRLAPGPNAPVAGLSLAPLLAGLPRLEALARALVAERAALAEGRLMIRIERRAARRAVEGLAAGHPARAAFEALRGAGFRPSARFATRAAIAGHLAELRAVIEAAPAPGPGAAEEALDAAVAMAPEGLDDAIRSGAPRMEERCHTEDPTDPQTGSWSAADDGGAGSAHRTTAREEPAGPGRERDERAQAGAQKRTRGETRPPDGTGTTEADGTRDGERAEETEKTSTGPVPPSRLSPALLRRLTPRSLRDLGSEEMRLYTDGLEPPGTPVTLRALERAAFLRRRELGITPRTWEEAETTLGWLDALVALVVVDRNRTHPTAPVRNPGGLLRDLARRRRAGALDLGASVMAIWRREEGAASVRSEAPEPHRETP